MLWLDTFDEGIDLAETHRALCDLEVDDAAIILLHLRTHPSFFDIIDDSSDSVLHQELPQHIFKIDEFALFNPLVESIKQTVGLEFIGNVCFLKLMLPLFDFI